MSGVRFGLVLAITLCAGGCAQVVPPPEVWRAAVANPEQSLHLVDEENWRVFEVRQPAFGRKRLELREEGTPAAEPTRVPWKGVAWRWFSPVNLVVDPEFYERNGHSANYRFQHPWSGQDWVLAARARSHSVRGVSLPMVEEAAPRLLFFEGHDRPRDDSQPIGQLTLDAASRRFLFGQLQSREIELEQVGTLAWDREPGLLQHLTAPFPGSGEFVVRIDGRETARFLRRPQSGSFTTYRLAIRRDLGDAERDLSLWLFLAFDRMREFVWGLDSH